MQFFHSFLSNTLFSLISTFLLFYTVVKAAKLPKNGTVLAVFAFGDSIVDTGMNNNIDSIAKSNFPPYGRDFKDGPTGRFTNGRVPSDLVAEAWGVKQYLPQYHDPNLQSKDLETGVCFASAGSGFDPITHTIQNVLSMSDQVEFFEQYIGKLKSVVGVERAKTIIANGLYLVSAGNNDIALSFYATKIRKLQYRNDITAYNNDLVAWASSFFKDLYDLGARNLAVMSTLPLGCLPVARTLLSLNGECPEYMNQAAQMFNTKLSSELDSINRKLPGANMVLIDVFNPCRDIIKDPKKFGFEFVEKGCCGTGKVELSVFCNRFDIGTCTNASNFLFWDSAHPTEKAYRVLLSQIL